MRQVERTIVVLAAVGLAAASITDYPDYRQQIRTGDTVKTLKNDQPFLRGLPHGTTPVTECVFVTSEHGPFVYSSETVSSDTVCGVYFLTDPDRRVELRFVMVDVSCENKDLVSIVDGWELNGELFPSEADRDHGSSSSDRISEFCGRNVPGTFVSSQNAALIQYRISEPGKGFIVHARYPKLFAPCNVLAVSLTEPFTLRNYGRRINCTYTALYPSIVQVEALRVGLASFLNGQFGTLAKCEQASPWDQVEIVGGHGLDTSKAHLIDSICGIDPKSDYQALVEYGVTSVRLISSGLLENFVTVSVNPV